MRLRRRKVTLTSVGSEGQATFYELQRISPERFHDLGDLLLPSIVSGLADLRKHGLNSEGKTRKGTPDSFVGDAPATCQTAVEYSTQDEDLGGKLVRDYWKVRKQCPQATKIVLCVNRSTQGLDLSAIEEDAASNHIALHVVDGCKITNALCQFRQDLRARFLGIPIDAHTYISLVRAMGERLDDAARGKVESQALDRFILRPSVERAVQEATHGKLNSTFLIVAPAGVGKTTWSFEYAKRHAGVEPVLWLPVTDLGLTQTDPISLAVVQAAYGSADPKRINELADLLRRDCKSVRIIIDAIDEARDYAALVRCLRAFRMSCLAKLSNVLLTCREASIPLLRQELGPSYPELFEFAGHWNRRSSGCMRLVELDRDQALALLRKAGATHTQAQTLRSALPEQFRGVPLFLLRAFNRVQKGLPAPEHLDLRDWLNVFASDFVNDIAGRLQTDGRRPGNRQILDFLDGIALRAIDSADATVTRGQLHQIPGGEEEGENTLLERAIQAGLLVKRTSGGVSFSHAVFLEYFAASALSRDADVTKWMARLRGDSGCEVLVKLVTTQAAPADVLRALLKHDPMVACEVAVRLSRVDDVGLRQAIVDEAAKMLESRFHSEIVRGLRLLGGLRWPESCSRAIGWYNGLPQSSRGRWISTAADLFLSQQEIGAFQVILGHIGLAFEWYEPAFVKRIVSLPEKFRVALIAKARLAIENDAPEHKWAQQRLTKLLAILQDDWLVEYFRKKIQRTTLEDFEHRALIHLNSHEAITAYAESVAKYWELDDRVSVVLTDNAKEGNADTYYQYMLKGTDILMFNHDALKEWVAAVLESADPKRVMFALDWAGFLGEEGLLLPCYAAMRRLPEHRSFMYHGLVSNIIKHVGAEHAIGMYIRYEDADIRKDIVNCLYEAPGPETEVFLRERLKEETHQFSAIQSLGFLGAVSAAPAIQELLQSADGHVRFMAAKVLGRLRYVPAVGDLVRGMKDGNTYGCDQSLGRIGTAEAYRALRERFLVAKTDHEQKDVLVALVRRREPEGIEAVKRLLAESADARSMIASVIGYPDLVERPNEIDDLGPLLSDSVLVQDVIDSARIAITSGRIGLLDFSLRGVASFDAPEATAFLEEVACGALAADGMRNQSSCGNLVAEAKRLLSQRGHPSYQRQLVEDTLDNVRDEAPSWNLPELTRWPRGVVREVLLARISRGERLRVWIELLQWFADESDRDLFIRYELHGDEDVADTCHQYLRRHQAMAE